MRVRVCRVAELTPGALRAFAVPGATWPVLVALVDDEVIAMPGVCPHREVALADYGVLDGSILSCRVHGFSFDVHTGFCEHDPRLHLHRFPVTIVDDEIWIDLL
ncbi:MAG TPA: Rieske 2Fe-2S domain-containing protein [Kofleriaceae bacterium]|nr:Rieske 2Fe-2S domain-containing protein [Kofleriaceae bacterium]